MNTHMNLPTAANNWGRVQGVQCSEAKRSESSPDLNWLAAGGKFRPLTQVALVVALGLGGLMNSIAVRAEVDYTGSWFSCHAVTAPDRRDIYSLLIIEREKNQLSWFQEYGNYTVNGHAVFEKNHLVLRGCLAFKGVTTEGCDESNPPIYSKLKLSLFSRSKINVVKALKSGDSIKLTKKINHNYLSAKCEALAAEIAEKERK